MLRLWVISLAASTGCASTLARSDAQRYPLPRPNAITFWGHACCYIDVEGYGIVTDPVFDTRLSLRRRKVPAPPPAAYSGARVILVSHAHDDHLSPKTIATFPESTLVLCPFPAAKYLENVRQPVRAMRPGDEQPFPGGTIVAVAVHHPGGRYGTDAEADGRALGYVIRTSQATLFISGDTNLFPGFGVIGARYEPTVAILHVNGHLHSMDAVRAARALGARTIVPVHWGAYGYLWFAEKKQPRDVEELRAHLGPRLVPLALGTSMPLARPAPHAAGNATP
jgi:L-ascorbate metabolism protein UlaG (beta-lactamase superfamily)